MIPPLSQSSKKQLRQQIPLWLDNPTRQSRLPEIDLPSAHALWQRFAPFFAENFADVPPDGSITSPLLPLTDFQAATSQSFRLPESGMLWLKSDDNLPIAGSVKARGGIFEICQWAEQIAQQAGLLQMADDHRCFNSPAIRQYFAQHHVLVGSTGNLGLSIGNIAAALGFRVSVHMSADAKAWKKAALRARGVEVIEHIGAYHLAVAQGRQEAASNPQAYFVDDEHSLALMTGYATAAQELAEQWRDTPIDENNPVYVYLPCGVGGAPAGIAYGLKQQFGNVVHCVIVEPTAAPALLTSVMAQGASAEDFDLNGQTLADGLAVTRASTLASNVLAQYAHAFCTVDDADLQRMQAWLFATHQHYLEPSACAGLVAWAANVRMGCPSSARHLVWATGGGIVPSAERAIELATGQQALSFPFRLPERNIA